MAADSSVATSLAAALGAQKAYGAHSPGKAPNKIDATAEDFEAVFLTQMMERMFEGLSGEGPLGGGAGGGAYRSMLADNFGKTIAASGGIGLADHVRRELLALQQGSST